MWLVNVKKIRKWSNFLFDIMYLTPFRDGFLWIISRIPVFWIFDRIWINSADYYVSFFDRFYSIIKRAKIDYKGKSILEIGTGSSIGMGYSFLVTGAKNFTASDSQRSLNMSKKAVDIEKRLIQMVENKYDTNIAGKFVKIDEEKIIPIKNLHFRKLDVTLSDIDLSKKYDLIISVAVLEHIRKDKVETALKNMIALLNKNGRMIHHIDLRDHFNFNRPFNFYKYSESEWSRLTNFGVFYTNRLRVEDYVKLFEKGGFEVTYLRRNRKKIDIKKIKAKANIKFQNYSDRDLQSWMMEIALQKRNSG